MMPKVFIADDHPLIVKGLVDILEEENIKVIGKAYDGQAALNFILKNEPEIAILDLQMPHLTGIEIAQFCQKNGLKTKIILITLHKEMDLYLDAKKYNIYGYLLKEFAIQEIKDCVMSVKYGERYFSAELKNYLGFTEEDKSVLKDLSTKELRVLKLIAELRTNREIAEMLFISVRTVEKHRGKIILKLGLPHVTNSLLVWTQKNKHLLV